MKYFHALALAILMSGSAQAADQDDAKGQREHSAPWQPVVLVQGTGRNMLVIIPRNPQPRAVNLALMLAAAQAQYAQPAEGAQAQSAAVPASRTNSQPEDASKPQNARGSRSWFSECTLL